MSKLDITNMSIEGFSSYMNQLFNWDQPGLNVIQASNGKGKSKLINALVWCLYGKTLSGSVTPWGSIQNKDYHGTKVEVNFIKGNNQYTIIRCKDYKKQVLGAKGNNRLIILKGGSEISDKGKMDKQKYIDDLLGFSLELFKNSIIFGQKLKKLINETGPNKKKVLDEAFEIAYISKGRKIVEERLTKVKLDLYQLEPRLEMLVERLEVDKRLLARLRKEEEDRINNSKGLMDSLKKEIGELEKIIKNSEVQINGEGELIRRLSTLRETINSKSSVVSSMSIDIRKREVELKSDKRSFEGSIKSYELKIKELEESLLNIPEKCPRCRTPLSHKSREIEKLLIKRDIRENKDSIRNLEESIKDTELGILRLNKRVASLNKKELSLETLISEKIILENLLKEIGELKKTLPKDKKTLYDKRSQLKDLDNPNSSENIKDLEESIKKLELEIEDKKYPVVKLKSERKLLQWMINDPLSNSGIKVFVFDSMMDRINDRLQYYSDYIGFNIRFSVNLQSKLKEIDTFILKGEEILPYEDLSGGQQQAVDIATIFAVHDVVTENKSCNLMVMDEIFEGLDSSNIELVTELIQDKSKGKSLFLVTHRSEFIPTHANIIKINNKNGVSFVA